MATPIVGISAERRAELVGKLLTQTDLFDGLDGDDQALALLAAEALADVRVRQLAEALLVLLDHMEVSPEERAAIAAEAWRIRTGRDRVELTPEGRAALAEPVECAMHSWTLVGGTSVCIRCGTAKVVVSA